jgi:hypothetical protein
MANLNDLSQSGLAALLQQDPQAYEDLLFNQARTEIERQGGDRAQQISENAFGRGLGLSTVNAYSQAENQRAQKEAISKARVDASTAARSAQLSALAQAAGVAQQEANRGMQHKAIKAQQQMNDDKMLAGGLTALGGAGLGLGMKAFGPEAINGIRGFAGLNPMYNTGSPSFSGGGLVQSPGASMTDSPLSFNASSPIDFSMPQADFGGGALSDLGDFSASTSFVPDFGDFMSQPTMGLDALGGLDFSSLIGNTNWDWSF